MVMQVGRVQHHQALPRRRLHRDKAHGGPRPRLTDRLRIRRAVLVPFHIGLLVARRRDAHLMAEHQQAREPSKVMLGKLPRQSNRAAAS